MCVEDHRGVICTGRRHPAGVEGMFLYGDGNGSEIFTGVTFFRAAQAVAVPVSVPPFDLELRLRVNGRASAVARPWHEYHNDTT
jgi:hypothetical protein